MNKHPLIIAAVAVLGVAAYLVPANAQVANVSTTDISIAGRSLSTGLQNASGLTHFENDGHTLLVIKGGASAVTATLVTQKATVYRGGYGSIDLANKDVSVPANAIVIAGPFPTGRWNTVSSTVRVSFTSVVGVSATAVRIP